MRERGRAASDEVLEHRTGVFVGWHRCSERDIAEVLDRIGQRVVTLIPLQPIPVAQGKQLRTKCGKTQKVVGAVFGHVDGQIVAGEDFEIRADLVLDL